VSDCVSDPMGAYKALFGVSKCLACFPLSEFWDVNVPLIVVWGAQGGGPLQVCV